MSYLDKLYDIGEKKINELRKKTSDPLQEFEYELKILRTELQNALKASAKIKAMLIQANSDISYNTNKAEKLSVQAQEIIHSKTLVPETAEKAALHILILKKNALNKAKIIKNSIPNLQNEEQKLDAAINNLKENITKYEIQLDNFRLKAKIDKITSQTAETPYYTNNESGTIERLEKLRTKIELNTQKENVLADLYSDIEEDELDPTEAVLKELEDLKKTKI